MNREFLTVGPYIPVQEVTPLLSADQAIILDSFSYLFQKQQDDPLSPIFDSFYMVVASIAKGSLGPASPSEDAEVLKEEILTGLTEVMRIINNSRSGNLHWPRPDYYKPSSQPSWWEGIWKSTIRREDSQSIVSYARIKRKLSFNWYQYDFFKMVHPPAPYYLTASFWNRIYSLENNGIIHNGFQVERRGWEVGPKGFLRPSREAGRSLLNDYIGPLHIMEIARGSIEDCLTLQRALMRRLKVSFLEPLII